MSEKLNEHAVQWYNQAVMSQDTDPQISYKLVTSALELEPTFAEGWHYIAEMNKNNHFYASAIGCFRRALETDSKNGKLWTNLSHALYESGKIEEAKLAAQTALSLDDTLSNAWLAMSMIQSVEGDIHSSVKSARRSYEIDPTPITEFAMGFAYLHARDLKQGLRWFEAKLPYRMANHLSFPWPRWSGEDLTDQTIFIMADQGMGDTLDYLRFIPLVAQRCKTVILQIQGELMRLAQMMLSDHSNIEYSVLNAPFPDANFWVPITSIPVALDMGSEAIENTPQLSVPEWQQPAQFASWKTPKRKLHVGVAWAGAPGNDIDKYRSMRIDDFLEFCQVPGVQLYSFQVGQRSQDVHITGSIALIKDMTIFVRDVADTVGFLRELDLVIAVESFLPHLCNAIGKEVWMPYSHLGGDWRAGRKGQRPVWHPHTKFFHQTKEGKWGPVVENIVSALRKRVANA